MSPNRCLCPTGQIASSCASRDPQSTNSTSCMVSCLNGGTCQGTRCVCPSGFQGPYCGQPVCRRPCLNGGRCTGPNRCACNYGFNGNQCQGDYRTGPCFTQLQSNVCKGQLIGVVCTKNLCCSTIGRAWGKPCEQCPERPAPCRRGFMYNQKDRKCHDVDECAAIPGLCIGAKCSNTLGSYRCQCDEGQTRNPVSNICEDTNECSQTGLCYNGRCINTDGSFRCVCNPGFSLSTDGTYCTGQRSDIHQ
ncbi:hypothetical protein CAPTEDRAFT_201242 [Capitella teleta]|uniref:Uncharacterized protein n=1 Tax=Capitella teleta TaxID=283909 RepID=R7V398_CAPTE|nr:hypothetical protein CAPTEDRAFT_201242 [Capitella teleta]|eukprot:ELU10265.1 hypothetical protein CAPTEDRAFT_201242 [Capitella teleta]